MKHFKEPLSIFYDKQGLFLYFVFSILDFILILLYDRYSDQSLLETPEYSHASVHAVSFLTGSKQFRS